MSGAGQEFGEEEVSAIVRRAAALQASTRELTSDVNGLSEEQLIAASGEMGIQPEFVIEAIRQQTVEASLGERAPFWGGPVETRIERVFEGVVTPDQWPSLLADLRSCTGTLGSVPPPQGGVIDWTVGDLSTTMTLVESEGRTRVLVHARTSELRSLFYLAFAFLPFLVAIGASQYSGLVWSLCVFLALVVGFFSAHLLTNRVSRSRRRRAFAIAGVVERFLRGGRDV